MPKQPATPAVIREEMEKLLCLLEEYEKDPSKYDSLKVEQKICSLEHIIGEYRDRIEGAAHYS